MVQLYIICMEITQCNNYDLYNGACGMFGSTGMIIHINAILNCVGLNAFCTHLIPAKMSVSVHSCREKGYGAPFRTKITGTTRN